MVSFNPYTKPVSPGQTYLPLSDEVLLMGAKSAYDQKDKTAQKIGSTYNSLFGISTYGKDAEVLSQFQQDFENQVAELSKANLRDPEVTSKINSLITQYSSNPDVLNIHKRASFYNNELKKEQEAAEKGQKYRSPGRESIEKYYNSGVYYRNPENINYSSGWVSPDTTKAMQDAVKMSTKEIRDPKTGVVTKQAKPEDISKSFYEIMKNNPNYQRDLQYSFEKENEGVDWNNHGQEFIQNKANTLQQQFQDAVSLGDLETAQMIKNEYSRLQSLSDPSLIGDNLKQQYFQNYIQNQLDKVGYANDVSDFVKIEIDPIQLKLQDLANQKAAKLYELQLESGVNPKDYTTTESFIKAATDKIQQNKKDIESQKQEGRMSLAQLKTGVKQGKVNNPDNVVIEEFGFTPKEIRTKLAEGNLPIARMIIENNPSLLGINKEDYDPNKLIVDSDSKQVKYDGKVVNIKSLMDEINSGVSDNTTELPYYSISGNNYIFYSPMEGTIVLPKNDTILNDFLKEHPEAIKK